MWVTEYTGWRQDGESLTCVTSDRYQLYTPHPALVLCTFEGQGHFHLLATMRCGGGETQSERIWFPLLLGTDKICFWKSVHCGTGIGPVTGAWWDLLSVKIYHYADKADTRDDGVVKSIEPRRRGRRKRGGSVKKNWWFPI